MNQQDKYQLFRSLALFHGLTDEELNQLIPLAEEVNFNPQDFIFKQGDTSSTDIFYIIASGYVDISKKDKNNVEYTIRTLTKGDTLGEISFITNKPRSATIRAYTQVKLIKFSITKIKDLGNLSLDLTLSQNAAKIVADRLDYAYTIAIESMRTPIEVEDNPREGFKTLFLIVLFLLIIESAVFFYYILHTLHFIK